MIIRFTYSQERCCVYYFESQVGSKKYVGVCKEKEKAQEEYDDAIAQGHGAYLMEQKGT